MQRSLKTVKPGKLNIRRELAKQFDVELPTETERTISPNEAAAMLGITGEAVKQWVYKGRLPAIKLHNGYWRIKASDLSQFLEGRLGSPKHSVLVAQSDSQTIETVRKSLDGMGHTVLLANGTVDAILKMRNERPSVLILDLDHQTGWALLDKVNANSPRNVLLLVSSELTPEQVLRVTESAAKAVVQKPLDANVLKRELQRIAGK